jgi:hypothetical protein
MTVRCWIKVARVHFTRRLMKFAYIKVCLYGEFENRYATVIRDTSARPMCWCQAHFLWNSGYIMFYENPPFYLRYIIRNKPAKAHTGVVVSWLYFEYEIRKLVSENRRQSSLQQWIVPRTSVVDCLKARCSIFVPRAVTFNILAFFPTRCICVLRVIITTNGCFFFLYGINRFAFLMNAHSVLCAVRPESLYII